MPPMDAVLENIVPIILLIVLLMVLTPLFLIIIRLTFRVRVMPKQLIKPSPPRPGGDSSGIDPWMESGRRLNLDAERPPDSDFDDEDPPPGGERFG